MKQIRRAKPKPPDFLAQGREAFVAGRFFLAAEAFAKAREAEPRNPVVLFNLASAKERIGEIGEAAQLLTEALHQRPSWEEPAQRLALLLARFVLPSAAELEPHGLLAAFSFDRIDLQPIAAAAIAHLQARTPLGEAIVRAEDGQGLDVAREWVLRRTEKTLAHPLLLCALNQSANRHPGVERLLTALRRVMLLEVLPDRFADKALTGFALALAQQCFNNEHVFAVSAEEEAALAELTVNWAALRQGAPGEARKLLLHLLYCQRGEVPGEPLTREDCRGIRPRGLGDLLTRWLEDEETEAALGETIVAVGSIVDPTSRKVAAQYEAYPYPRWTSVQMPREASAVAMLSQFAAPEKLAFLDRPYRVLIAGAGTGKHAVAAGVRYGPQADVVAVDLSRRSLAYAKAKAERFGVGNLSFIQADLLGMPESQGPFDIIEAVGVLHHMEEPFKGWQALIRLLRPGGFLLTGLYSGVSRQNVAAIRQEASYPGASCGAAAARAYRAALMDRKEGAGGELKLSYDFYTMSNFRDLVLHEHERPVFLSEVEAFIEQNGLAFRGFSLPPPITAAFLQTFADDRRPGKLANWAKFEEQYPRTFDGMYQIWCEKL